MSIYFCSSDGNKYELNISDRHLLVAMFVLPKRCTIIRLIMLFVRGTRGHVGRYRVKRFVAEFVNYIDNK